MGLSDWLIEHILHWNLMQMLGMVSNKNCHKHRLQFTHVVCGLYSGN
jgi:hypothetical protein